MVLGKMEIPVNNSQFPDLETILVLIGSFFTWCNDKHLQLNISRNNKLVGDFCCMSVSQKSQIPCMSSHALPINLILLENKEATNSRT